MPKTLQSPVASAAAARGSGDPWGNYRALQQHGCLVLRIPYKEFGWKEDCFETEAIKACRKLRPDASSRKNVFEGFDPLTGETFNTTHLRQEEGISREANREHYQRLQQLFDYYFHGTPLEDLKVASSSGLISFPGAPSQFRHLDVKLQREASERGVSFLMPCTHHAHLHVWRGSTAMLEAVVDSQDVTSEVVAYEDDISDGELTQRAMEALDRPASTILPMETVVAHPHSVVVFFGHLVHAGAAWSAIWNDPNIRLHAYFSAAALPENATVPLPRWLQWATEDALGETERLEVWLGKRDGCNAGAGASRRAGKRRKQ